VRHLGGRARLSGLLETLWFLPGVIVLVFAVVAVALSIVETHVDTTSLPLVFPGDAEAAQNVLSSVAGSIITVAGLTLSITMVVLQLVATQYTPRALRQVLRDRLTQATSGVFVGVFVFALIVLRTVRNGNVPALGVTLSILLGVAALALLLVFINNVAESIQIGTIAADARRQTVELVRERYPEERPDEVIDIADLPALEQVVRLERAGYVQLVDLRALEQGLPDGSWVVDVLVRPGDFVTPRSQIAALRGRASDDAAEAVRAAVAVKDHRTLAQDEAFGLRLLADIALRALSPGVNDPTTALTAIQHAGVILEEIATRYEPPRSRSLADGRVIVILERRDFVELLDPLREVARSCTDERPLVGVLQSLAATVDAARDGGRPENAATAARTAAEILDRAVGHCAASVTPEARRIVARALAAANEAAPPKEGTRAA
jgi:uncharacterized membrane protein